MARPELPAQGDPQPWGTKLINGIFDISDRVDTVIPAAMNLRAQTGVAGDGVADDTDALQSALNSAAALGARAFANGTFRCNGTLTFTGPVDMSLATIQYYGTGVALQVGNPDSALWRTDIRLPSVIAANKINLGWAEVSGTVGLRVSNCYSCFIQFFRIRNFETGFMLHGKAPNGSSYNEFRMGHLDNCKVNQALTPDNGVDNASSGWANQNLFLGGRHSHDSNEGIQVAGTRNILISESVNIVNGNTWVNTSIESPDVVEYHIECFGQYNYFDRLRYENPGGNAHRRIYWRAVSKGNVINGGFNSGNITEVVENGAANSVRSDVFNRFVGGNASQGVIMAENAFSSTGPLFIGLAAGATASGVDPVTNYCIWMTSQMLLGKRATDTFPRFKMDFLNGRMSYGDGTFDPTAYFGASVNTVYLSSGPFSPLTNNAQDLGLSTLKWRYIRAASAVQTGAVTTAGRPSASAAGAGAHVLDTSLGRPVWSDGTSWTDPIAALVAATNLNDLNNVTSSPVTDKDILMFDNASGEWVSAAVKETGALDDREAVVRWDSDTGTWGTRSLTDPFGVVFLSTNDPDAPAPNDPNLQIGDVWRRHPDAVTA